VPFVRAFGIGPANVAQAVLKFIEFVSITADSTFTGLNGGVIFPVLGIGICFPVKVKGVCHIILGANG
jgi:hypothetical protein